MKRELYGLLISGSESRFADNTLKFQDFLVDEVGLNPYHLQIILCTYREGKYLLEESRNFFASIPRDGNPYDVLLFYNGHGGKGSFFPNRVSVSYEEWAKLINNPGDFIFLNQSCFSGSSIEAFCKLGLLTEKGLVITSARSDELSYSGMFLEALMEDYRQGKAFERDILSFQKSSEGIINYIPQVVSRKQLDDGTTVLTLDGGFRFEPYPEPIISHDDVHHPVRMGKSLDHLLFAMK